MGGISIWQLLIVLAIVVIIFGTKKFRSMGGDLGGAIRSFKRAMKGEGKEDEEAEGSPPKVEDKPNRVIEGQVTSKDKKKA